MQLFETIQANICGEIPPPPDHLRARLINENRLFCAGKAIRRLITLTAEISGQEYAFPLTLVLPVSNSAVPLILLARENGTLPGEDCPIEEIVDRGFAVCAFPYPAFSADNGDFRSGIARALVPSRKKHAAPGKLALWAWGMSRAADFLLTLRDVDRKKVFAAGLGVGGQIAFLAAASDERFAGVFAVGAALHITPDMPIVSASGALTAAEVFPHRFAPRFSASPADGISFADLIRQILPRKITVSAAKFESDYSARAEFSALCASAGIVASLPSPVGTFTNGGFSYRLREGAHGISREDWNAFLDRI